MKLSEAQFRRIKDVALHYGDKYVFSVLDLPSSVSYYFTSAVDNDDCFFAYSVFIGEENFYFCIDTSIFKVRRLLHELLSIEEIALFLYLVFCEHKIFDL